MEQVVYCVPDKIRVYLDYEDERIVAEFYGCEDCCMRVFSSKMKEF